MASKKNSKQLDLSAQPKWGIGVGLTAAAVAAAGTYFLYGSKDAAKNRKTVKSWMLKAKAEVLEALEHAQTMSRAEYEQLVNSIGATYAQLQATSKKDIKDFKEEMLAQWKNIENLAHSSTKSTKKSTKKIAKKSARKSPAKTAPKKSTAKKTATKKVTKQARKK